MKRRFRLVGRFVETYTHDVDTVIEVDVDEDLSATDCGVVVMDELSENMDRYVGKRRAKAAKAVAP